MSDSAPVLTDRDLLEAMIDAYAQSRRRAMAMLMKAGIGRCESPIERVLLGALMIEATHAPAFPVRWSFNGIPADPAPGTLHCTAQHPIEHYRVDFALIGQFPKAAVKIAVECDGHDFHERTKEQAAHDKQRDRFLQRAGFKVLRFTGSEIWQHADRCAAEVFTHAWCTAVGELAA